MDDYLVLTCFIARAQCILIGSQSRTSLFNHALAHWHHQAMHFALEGRKRRCTVDGYLVLTCFIARAQCILIGFHSRTSLFNHALAHWHHQAMHLSLSLGFRVSGLGFRVSGLGFRL